MSNFRFCWLHVSDIVTHKNSDAQCLVTKVNEKKKTALLEVISKKCPAFTVKWAEIEKNCTGTIIHWDPINGHGLIWSSDKEEYFVEKDAIAAAGFKALRVNERVQFIGYYDRCPRAAAVHSSSGQVVNYEKWSLPQNKSLEDLQTLPPLQNDGERLIGVVAIWGSNGRGWIVVPHRQPIYARDYDVVAKGRKALCKDMIVEFEVKAQDEDSVFASKITSPEKEAICIETGIARKYLLTTNTVPDEKKHYMGVVKIWKQDQGVIQKICDGGYVGVSGQDGVMWDSDCYEKSLLVGDRVRFCIRSYKNTEMAIEVTHDNGLKYDINYSKKRMKVARTGDGVFLATSPPDGSSIRGPIRGIVQEWRASKLAGTVESELGNIVYVHMGAIQSSDTKPGLKERDTVEFYLRGNVDASMLIAEHVTKPFNVIYSIPTSHSKKDGDPMKTGQWRCEICNLNLSSRVTLTSHLNGRAHLKRQKETEDLKHAAEKPADTTIYLDPSSHLFCACCLWQGIDEDDFLNHVDTPEHTKSEGFYGSDPELEELPEGYMYHCRACNKKMATLDNWMKHEPGKKHKHMMDLASMKYRECTLCNVVFTGRKHMVDHINGRRHQDRVSEVGRDPHGDWEEYELERENAHRRFKRLLRKSRKRKNVDYGMDDDSPRKRRRL